MREFKDIVDKLNEFTSPDDIAAHLEEHEILAVPRSASSCAISEYVRQEMSTAQCNLIYTSFHQVQADPTQLKNSAFIHSGDLGTVDLSPVVGEFMMKFDERKYPELIDSRPHDV